MRKDLALYLLLTLERTDETKRTTLRRFTEPARSQREIQANIVPDDSTPPIVPLGLIPDFRIIRREPAMRWDVLAIKHFDQLR